MGSALSFSVSMALAATLPAAMFNTALRHFLEAMDPGAHIDAARAVHV